MRPRVLLITGDLVHATGEDNKVSGQRVGEWEVYNRTLVEGGLVDASGQDGHIKVSNSIDNHDTFNQLDYKYYEEFGHPGFLFFRK